MHDGMVLYISIASLLILFVGLKKILSRESLSQRATLANGYNKNSSTWKMWTSDYPLYIIPVGALPSLRTERKVDLPTHVHDQYQTKYTGAMCSSAFMRSVQVDLNNHLILTQLSEWQSILAFDKALRIIGLVSGRANVGHHLSRKAEWLDLYCLYPILFFSSITAICKWPSFLRPIVQYMTPQLKQMRKVRARLTEMLASEFEAQRNGKSQAQNNMINWVWKNSTEKDRTTENQSLIHILATVPSTYTVSFAIAQCIFDLGARPEYIPILREEFQSILDSCGGTTGLTKESFSRMTKLDSFMKESQRLNPLALVSFERTALESITLADGTHIPKGAHIAAPSYHIGHDPKYFENPDEFDGLRFHRLQENEKNGSGNLNSKHQYVSVNETSLHFGYGLQACPGRWFAAIEIKLFLGFLLQKYDIALVDAGKGRPTSEIDRFFIYPDPEKMVILRKRSY
ncbi:cytochrome P450 [Aspergillus alliaceus]|uniref:cytochrome P450 n=1 Tax=Petromyces alliaceus TaxID=209559 RepID=UPI0012A45238|nr:cytochrome P450 [Aspergillus alliaceus]KAB8235592.1 cytochrome P450 [Aspergillus alliaceus]